MSLSNCSKETLLTIAISIVKNININEDNEGQRLDNFLFKVCKGVPKSHIYKMIRTGKIKINNKKANSNYKLLIKDLVFLPDIRVSESKEKIIIPRKDFSVVYEDDGFIVLDKPCGLAVHGGSGLSFGLIEQLRISFKQNSFLELVHRLDKDTSGLLIVAKKRGVLLDLHKIFREGRCYKSYIALVKGKWLNKRQHIKLPLKKYITKSGERRVFVDDSGQSAHSVVNLIGYYNEYSLLKVEIRSGRTHQIRVHLSHSGFPIVGDSKYGNYEEDVCFFSQFNFKRMFLHAYNLKFNHPSSNEFIDLVSDLPNDCKILLNSLEDLGRNS
ncbi:ribosomal large subunit pseudouridine synthase C [Candidatus Kinetoplastibacterium desouzaii TCC079E]|uniref:Pseudouridine synthase n=1 Tax=Candidatus Kinetoplastidibacterium desouzai TCC079E TaxID=1208919 RepID=M1L2N8_9PROT|nr:RluA family pseudouridine synthase [Candidatus Kinetoplastibacterium desouzaii]AGF47018.1 ribosomal large subunit pseudouridine synthase C [Candidatus Kinetoplastibacterium desouzaii TCC079E]